MYPSQDIFGDTIDNNGYRQMEFRDSSFPGTLGIRLTQRAGHLSYDFSLRIYDNSKPLVQKHLRRIVL